MKCGQVFPTIYEDFISLDDFDDPSRDEDVLDFFLTSNHTLVDEIKISAGIADQDVVVAMVNVKPKITEQIPRKVPLFRKANCSNFKTYMAEKKNEILNLQQSSNEEIWTAFKTALRKGLTRFVSIKKIGCKKILP